MPRRDGTGPEGRGPRTGRGRGLCTTRNVLGAGLGLGLGLGLRRRFGRRGFEENVANDEEEEKYLLMKEKAMLQEKIDLLNKELDTFDNEKKLSE